MFHNPILMSNRTIDKECDVRWTLFSNKDRWRSMKTLTLILYITGDFLFPKKVLIGNFKAEVISERTEAFHKFLNLISSCDSLLYSDYFYSFLTSEEHNEAVSHIKLGKYGEAVPLLETIFYIREKLLTASNIVRLI